MIAHRRDGTVEMIRYRLCYINPKTGQVDRERELEAVDDVDAIHAAQASDHRPLELWCGTRKLQSFEAGEQAPLHA